MGMPAPPFCSWLLPHSRVTAVDVNQFLKHLQFTARHVNTNQSGWWLMRPTVNYSSQTLAQSC